MDSFPLSFKDVLFSEELHCTLIMFLNGKFPVKTKLEPVIHMGSVRHGNHGVPVSEIALKIMRAAGFTIIRSFSKLLVEKKQDKEACKHHEP